MGCAEAKGEYEEGGDEAAVSAVDGMIDDDEGGAWLRVKGGGVRDRRIRLQREGAATCAREVFR